MRLWLETGMFPIPMRGNELSPRTSGITRMIGFPIPMRGNEMDVLIRQPQTAATWFPIPMRGNEQQCPVLAGRDVLAFPIPMRGNEGCAHGLAADHHVRFPIPMRGNEAVGVLRASKLIPEVPNPHEG